MLRPKNLIQQAKNIVESTADFPAFTSATLKHLSREDVRTILWLIQTGKHDTITEEELQIEIDKNLEARKNKL